MPPQTTARLAAIRAMLNARTPREIATHFTFPMPAQFGPHLHVYRTAAELADGYAQRGAAKRQQGQSDFHCRIAAIELPRNNRFRVWVDWLYTDPDGTPRTGDRSIYFCSTFRGQIAVEMIHCAPQTDAAPVRSAARALA